MKKRRKLELVSLCIFIDDVVDDTFSGMMGCSEEDNAVYLFKLPTSKRKIFFPFQVVEDL